MVILIYCQLNLREVCCGAVYLATLLLCFFIIIER